MAWFMSAQVMAMSMHSMPKPVHKFGATMQGQLLLPSSLAPQWSLITSFMVAHTMTLPIATCTRLTPGTVHRSGAFKSITKISLISKWSMASSISLPGQSSSREDQISETVTSMRSMLKMAPGSGDPTKSVTSFFLLQR